MNFLTTYTLVHVVVASDGSFLNSCSETSSQIASISAEIYAKPHRNSLDIPPSVQIEMNKNLSEHDTDVV